MTENGGITDDDYIKHPEIFEETFSENEIPTVLEKNWNRNDNQHIFLSHRYSLGFKRKVKMTEEEIKAKNSLWNLQKIMQKATQKKRQEKGERSRKEI